METEQNLFRESENTDQNEVSVNMTDVMIQNSGETPASTICDKESTESKQLEIQWSTSKPKRELKNSSENLKTLLGIQNNWESK